MLSFCSWESESKQFPMHHTSSVVKSLNLLEPVNHSKFFWSWKPCFSVKVTRKGVGGFYNACFGQGFWKGCSLHHQLLIFVYELFHFCCLMTRTFLIGLFKIAASAFKEACLEKLKASHVLQCGNNMVKHKLFLCFRTKVSVISQWIGLGNFVKIRYYRPTNLALFARNTRKIICTISFWQM